MNRHVLSILLENEPGALSRVVGLFSARGYNIESLTVAPTEDPTVSRMTIVSPGSTEIIEQITKHLNRLIEVIKVVDLTEGEYAERELMLVKVRAVGKDREEMKRLNDIFRGRIIDVTDKTYTIELTGNSDKLDAFLKAVDKECILEMARTGSCGIACSRTAAVSLTAAACHSRRQHCNAQHKRHQLLCFHKFFLLHKPAEYKFHHSLSISSSPNRA